MSATPRVVQCAFGWSVGTLRNMTKLDEWPVVASTPRWCCELLPRARGLRGHLQDRDCEYTVNSRLCEAPLPKSYLHRSSEYVHLLAFGTNGDAFAGLFAPCRVS
jgi:hypothetical protein